MESIQNIINEKVQQLVDDGMIQRAVETNIESAIKKAIEDQFSYRGGMIKQIEKAFEEGLKLNVKDIDFQTYNQQMLIAVKTKIGKMFHSESSSKFMLEMDKVLEPAPVEMTAKDFVEKIVSHWKEELSEYDGADNNASFELADKESTSMESVTLKLWKQKKSTSSYSSREKSPDLQLFFINGKIRINHNHSYNPTCFSDADAFVFKLYAAGTTIVDIDDLDEDDCDLSLKR